MTNNIRYGLRFRPATPGAVPKGSFSLHPAETGEELVARHGVIVFERVLDVSEITGYELILLADDQLKTELSREVAEKLSKYAEGCIKYHATKPYAVVEMVSNHIQKLRPYQVHIGDMNSFTEQVVNELSNHVNK
jgi:Defence against restriction A C-terminal